MGLGANVRPGMWPGRARREGPGSEEGGGGGGRRAAGGKWTSAHTTVGGRVTIMGGACVHFFNGCVFFKIDVRTS